MKSETLLVHALVIDPLNDYIGVRDLAIKDGVFARPEELHSPVRLDMTGLVVCPGFTDVHVHLRDPGQTYKEDLQSGTAAAAAGGFTSILAMPNTVPAMDTPEGVRDIHKRAVDAPVHVYQAACFSKGRLGEELSQMEELAAAGAPAFSDDGSTTQSDQLMESAMRCAAGLGLPIIDHCEDTSISKPGVMHRGFVSLELRLPGQPRVAEEIIVERDISLSRKTGCRVHLQHLSSAGSVGMLRKARKEGLKLSGEATPHHLFLTDEACRKYGTNAKMAPPLREESDRQALLQAVQDGTIEMIATDHAPHTDEEKARDWNAAPFGIVGIETVVPLCLSRLYHPGLLSLMQLVSLFTVGPRRLLNLPIGSLNIGEPADLTVLDLEKNHTIDSSKFRSRGRNCPYDGWECTGAVHSTFLAGNQFFVHNSPMR